MLDPGGRLPWSVLMSVGGISNGLTQRQFLADPAGYRALMPSMHIGMPTSLTGPDQHQDEWCAVGMSWDV